MKPLLLEAALQDMLAEAYDTRPTEAQVAEIRKLFFAGAICVLSILDDGHQNTEPLLLELNAFSDHLKDFKIPVTEATVANVPTEAQIREHVAALMRGATRPCDCLTRGKQHAMQCVVGGALMRANAEILNWVLGESTERHREMIRHINEGNRPT